MSEAKDLAPRQLWTHQERAIAELRTRILGGCSRIALQLPTGATMVTVAGMLFAAAVAVRAIRD